jgi:hypothetical protein
MVNEAKISKEVVRLSQLRTREIGVPLSDELARNVVQEAVYNADPEAELLIEDDAAYSANDALVAGLGVNDVVVNGKRFDVRTIDNDGKVNLNRSLLATAYMSAGTMAVDMNQQDGGKVVAFIPAAEWMKAEGTTGDDHTVSLKAPVDANFDVAAAIQNSSSSAPAASEAVPGQLDLIKLVANRTEVPVDSQKKMVNGLLTNPRSWSQLSEVVAMWSKGQVQTVLSDGATWNGRVEKITDLASARFKRLTRDDIKKIVAKLGETHGGQPESPAFRKALISSLTKEELTRLVSGATLKKASEVADAVLSGRAVTEVVKEIARNPVAVQIAGHIKRNRDKMGEFVDATTQEILGAFPQMALQPVYSTHTGQTGSSLEPINEALKMLYAGELAKNAKALDEELASL